MNSDRVERERELETLTADVGAEVKWFATGHAISAADLEGVTAAVKDLIARAAPGEVTEREAES
jgi:hypothetical protein